MDVDPSQPGSLESMLSDETENLFVRRGHGLRQVREQAEDLRAVLQRTERQLADHEWMTDDLRRFQQSRKTGVPSPKVIDPDGRVDQDHWVDRARRRRARRRWGSEPP